MILEVNQTDSFSHTEGGVSQAILIKICLVLHILFFWVGCETPQQPKAFIRLGGKAQGTTFSIIYLDSLNRNFTTQTDSFLRLIDKSMSLWDTTSVISNFNKNTPGTLADEHFDTVFRRSMVISGLTDGYFDVTVAPLVKAWGFHFKKNDNSPDDNTIKELLQCCGWQKIQLINRLLIKEQPCMQVDFNAIAQGYTVDLVAQFLEKQGVKDYMVEIGGEVRTAGNNESGKPWVIGIDKPVESTEGRPLQRTISLSGKSMATSGSYRKFVVRNGKKYSHMIDPKTGYPVHHSLLSVSVIANNCTDADALATAFMVMGLEKATVKAQALGISALFVYQNDKQELVEQIVGSLD